MTSKDAAQVAWLLGLRGDFNWFTTKTRDDPADTGALASHAKDALRGWKEAQDLMRRIVALLPSIAHPRVDEIRAMGTDPIAQLRLWLACLHRSRIADDSSPFTPEEITGLQRTWRAVFDVEFRGPRDLKLGEAEKPVEALLDRLACRGGRGLRPSSVGATRKEWEY